MLNLCHIFSLKQKKIYAFVLIVCLLVGLTPTAESISVKLRGKIVLGGILSGLAYGTYALVTRDKRKTEKLQLHLGAPDRVVEFERGFDRWRINYYGEQCYLFRNNLFIKTVPSTSLQSAVSRGRSCAYRQSVIGFHQRSGDRSSVVGNYQYLVEMEGIREGKGWKRETVEEWAPILPIFRSDFFHSNFLLTTNRYSIDTPVSGIPKWLRLYLSRPQRAPQFVSSYLYRSGAGHLLGLDPLPSH